MSGLNVENFNLFAKKPTTKPVQRPIAVAATPEVVEKELAIFDADIENTKEVVKLTQVIERIEAKAPVLEIEIERFEETKPAQTLATTSGPKHINKEMKAIEVTLRPSEKTTSDPALRKFETFVAPTFRIPEEHDLELKKIEHFIMRNRKKGNNSESRERITTNTVVRAMIANFLERAGDIDFSNIDNEEILKERMEKAFKQKYSKKN